MTQIIPGWYDTPGAQRVLRDISRDAVSKISKAEKWQSVPIANGVTHLHRAEDVRQYRDHQQRTQLVKVLGWKGRGLYRNEAIDIECPECGGFAVEWPAPPMLPEEFLCLKGHEESVHEDPIDPDTGEYYEESGNNPNLGA